MNEELKQLILFLGNIKDGDDIIAVLEIMVELMKYKRLWERLKKDLSKSKVRANAPFFADLMESMEREI